MVYTTGNSQIEKKLNSIKRERDEKAEAEKQNKEREEIAAKKNHIIAALLAIFWVVLVLTSSIWARLLMV